MKTFKLQHHPRSTARQGQADDFKEVEDIYLYLNPKDYPDLKERDIVEIYDVEDTFSRLLLQVKGKSFKDDYAHNTISVEDSVAKTFQLRAYRDVIVNKVSFEDVQLDLLELTVKDQYFSRSDMWRYKKALVGSCAHLHKKIEHGCGQTTVHEMWAKGTRVACGTIGESTKFVYRSMTANVYIFIQLSVEMWEFDFYGDLYFEKSVKGFLTDLFERWTAQKANHDVTIVLFSRTFYEADDLDDFPCSMRDGLLRDYKGRFYEDFYRIVVQNEKYDDWTFALIKLKTMFHEYTESVLNFHSHPGVKLPRAYNSNAAEGNVLEVLNMSLNVFEKHQADRNFERTGQMCVVITPSTGVFEVDRELLTLTKQKSIDYGIGNDLVFMGEQPLHVVPLFVLHNKRGTNEPVDYAIPNWLNYSYYKSKDANPNIFIPRIRIPEQILQQLKKKPFFFGASGSSTNTGKFTKDKIPQRTRPANIKKTRSRVFTERRLSESAAVPAILEETLLDAKSFDGRQGERHHTMLLSASLESANPLRPNANARSLENLEGIERKKKTGRSPNPPRSLINPLAPSKIPVKLTSNRRRWVHIFPTDATGAAVQTHHRPNVSTSEDGPFLILAGSPVSDITRDTDSPQLKSRRQDLDNDRLSSIASGDLDENSFAEDSITDTTKSPKRIPRTNPRAKDDFGRGSPAPSGPVIWGSEPKKSAMAKRSYVWGITGEMEWTPNLTTGVDWKALTVPASLPITTDYIPDRRTLQNDYYLSDYSVIPEETSLDIVGRGSREGSEGSRYYSRPLGLRELYEELICQRLQQGFQLIIEKEARPGHRSEELTKVGVRKSGQSISAGTWRPEITYLSLGKVIHKLTLDQSSVTVTRYTPRHPYTIPCVSYRYRFMVPDMMRYEVSLVTFSHERLETFNWNYLDFCVLTKGRGEFSLDSPTKCWKGQYFLLPCSTAVKKISDDKNADPRCDIYTEPCAEEQAALCEGAIRIMETVNRTKRPAKYRRNESALKKSPGVVTKPLHRSEKVAAMSTPDLQTIVGTPKSEGSMPNIQLLELQRLISAVGIDIVSTEVAGSPARVPFTSVKSWLSAILEAMKQPAVNVVMPKQNDLPPRCFISYEAVEWGMEYLKVSSAQWVIDLFDKMIEEGLIVHASGFPSHKFISGFYLYYIVDGKNPFVPEISNADVDFNQVWIECALLNPDKDRSLARAPGISAEFFKAEPAFQAIDSGLKEYALAEKKSSVIDVDMDHKSDRLEWAVANYHATFSPKCAFEFELKWIQSSGPMFGKMMKHWAGKCPNNGFHMVPIPADPFALPQKPSSDPLRMPIFVPLEWKCLDNHEDGLFHDFPAETRYLRTVLFREAVLFRFGFMMLQETSKRIRVETESRSYVHTTGGMFVMIPAQNDDDLRNLKISVGHFDDVDCRWPDNRTEMGFWFSWNSCLTRKWRTAHSDFTAFPTPPACRLDSTASGDVVCTFPHPVASQWADTGAGDEAFLDKMLADFRRFCSNEDNRLKDFWDACLRSATVPVMDDLSPDNVSEKSFDVSPS